MRQEYLFVYNGTDLYRGWYERQEVELIAIGMVQGLRYRKANPEVRVFELRDIEELRPMYGENLEKVFPGEKKYRHLVHVQK